MNLKLSFNSGQYSPHKDEFKKIFAGQFQWNRVRGWHGDLGFVEATEKMEPGAPVVFDVRCSKEMGEVFKTFCTQYSVSFEILPEDEKPEPIEQFELPWNPGEFDKYHRQELFDAWDPDFKVIWK